MIENIEKNLLTLEGKEKIEKRLEYLKKVRRPEIAETIQKAKEMGDLSENAEYHSAKEEQGLMEAEIVRLENILKSATLIENDSKKEIVNVGVKVKLTLNNKEQTFSIVSQEEIDVLNGAISYKSPLGQALMGRKKGDVFSFKTPKGEIKIKILSIF